MGQVMFKAFFCKFMSCHRCVYICCERCGAEITRPEVDHIPRVRFNWLTLKEEVLKGMCRGREELELT